MGLHKFGNYEIEIEFIREKYGLARWDYEIKKDGEVVGSGVDRMTSSFDEKEAIMEIVEEDIEMNKEEKDIENNIYSKNIEESEHKRFPTNVKELAEEVFGDMVFRIENYDLDRIYLTTPNDEEYVIRMWSVTETQVRWTLFKTIWKEDGSGYGEKIKSGIHKVNY